MNAIGQNTNPISLNAKNDNWKGIYVINSKRKSKLRNLNISNVKALEDGLLKLTGAINFYRSDVDFENVRVENIEAEDAINIVESIFTINNFS